MNLLLLLASAQQDSAATDTLTESYSGKWKAASEMNHSAGFIQMMGSHDLIFIVLGVSLIIWFVLLFFIIRTDKKVSKLEETLNQQSSRTQS